MDSYALQRRLTCILAADAVGYSKHMGQDEEGTIQVLAAHRAVIDGIIAFHRGRIVGTAGDSVLAEFTSAVEAVRCAVEIQDALRTRNDALPEHRRLLFRVGVNLGDVVVKDADLLGDGVNVAARLESLAEPGGICIASSVYDQITGKLDLGFQDIGEQSLKNITRPVRVYRVSGARPLELAAPPPMARASGAGARPIAWVLAGAALAVVVGAGTFWLQGWMAPRSATMTAPQPSVLVSAPAVGPVSASVATSQAQVPQSTASAQTLARAASESTAAPVAKRVVPKPTVATAQTGTVGTSAAPAPAPAPASAAVVAATPVPALKAAAVVAAASAAAHDPTPSEMSAFDGNWLVRVRCPRHEDALGYSVDLVGQVKNGLLFAETGSAGEANWLQLRGKIDTNGRAQLYAQGLTGDPRFSLKGIAKGSRYQYDVQADFNADHGQGRRLGKRPCDLFFDRS